MASRVALSAAAAGRTVQVVGRVGDDATADAVLLDLAKGGVGHVAILRDAARTTAIEPGDDSAPDVELETVDAAPDETPEDGTPSPPGLPLDAADVELGLRYLTDFAVVAVTDPATPDVVAVVVDAARWATARLVAVVEGAATIPSQWPVDATIVQAPASDPDGAFATLVGRYVAALDEGVDAGDAFRRSLLAVGGTESPDA